jgi:hypothetical protein
MHEALIVTADDESGCSLRCVQVDVLKVHSMCSHVLSPITVRYSTTAGSIHKFGFYDRILVCSLCLVSHFVLPLCLHVPRYCVGQLNPRVFGFKQTPDVGLAFTCTQVRTLVGWEGRKQDYCCI